VCEKSIDINDVLEKAEHGYDVSIIGICDRETRLVKIAPEQIATTVAAAIRDKAPERHLAASKVKHARTTRNETCRKLGPRVRHAL
jgi:hypothetical protein